MQFDEGHVTTPDGVRLHYRKSGNGPRTIVIPNGDYLLDPFAALTREHMLIVYDLRNRGRSETVADPSKLKGGVRNDVDDLDCVRRYFGLARFSLLAHSYVGFVAGLYTIGCAHHVERLAMLAPSPPFANRQYPEHLRHDDGVVARVLGALQQMHAQAPAGPVDVDRCRRSWELLRQIYVTDQRNAARADWGRCELANERNFMPYFMQYVVPSMQSASPQASQLAMTATEVLVVHGRKDRSAPYGGGRDWVLNLPNSRLLTVPEGGHAPWIESPEVLAAVDIFFRGGWPDGAERPTGP